MYYCILETIHVFPVGIPSEMNSSRAPYCCPPLWQAEKLCGSVELGLGPDAPLLVKYDLESGENGHMKFYLAPKIDE